jgi:hypothetical protein
MWPVGGAGPQARADWSRRPQMPVQPARELAGDGWRTVRCCRALQAAEASLTLEERQTLDEMAARTRATGFTACKRTSELLCAREVLRTAVTPVRRPAP